jgi:hypothetical protein
LSKNQGTLKEHVIKTEQHEYFIQTPAGKPKIKAFVSPHGQSFEILYRDGSLVYLTDDSGVPSPNLDNYSRIGFLPPLGEVIRDTTIAGIGVDGKGWKEIFRDGYSIGYRNVQPERMQLFDSALTTFQIIK